MKDITPLKLKYFISDIGRLLIYKRFTISVLQVLYLTNFQKRIRKFKNLLHQY